MSLIVISDLHIWGPDDPLYASLLALVRQRTESGDTMVFAGDLFDLFVGNKAIFTEKYAEFFRALLEAGNRGVKLHYIEGNHDFLLNRAFEGIPNFTMHTHDVTVEIQNRRFYFAHGDTVNKRDYKYRVLRSVFRSHLMKALVALFPGAWVERFGAFSSERSRTKNPRLPTDLGGKRMEILRRIYRSYAAERLAEGYDFVVLGHCHDLDEMFFNIGGRHGQYVNVGFPRVHGSYLSWAPGEEKIQREKLPD